MAQDPDGEVFGAATGLGCFALAAALALIPLFVPAYLLYKVAVRAGVASFHPAVVIVLLAATVWALWRLGGTLIRSMPPRAAQLAIALYVGGCYTFGFFQRELTTARTELDVAWLSLAFAVFAFVGWKIGGVMVFKAHRDHLLRLTRSQARTP